jgi:glutamate N-acetyltransferase/amino-acid N-acetyltransferase
MKKPSVYCKIPGSITTPRGFRAAGTAAGIKPRGKKDLALIVSDVPATVAATFTTNQVKAAPVRLSMRHVKTGRARAIVVNSGIANAGTGTIGMLHARAMAAAVARRIGCRETDVLVCSTGRIGELLPIVKVEAGIKKLLGILSASGGAAAAEAILTTDSFPKQVAVRIRHSGRVVHIAGMAKGAGMIHPKMATMLCFITTDAAVSRRPLQRALCAAVNASFNRISVDGDTSTNDTVIALANGLAGPVPMRKFQAGLDFVCLELAKMIVRDGEGAGKFVTVQLRGARNNREAELAARAVANSVLVKTSWCGGDPNWGRILDALGYSGAKVQEALVDISYDGVAAVRGGVAAGTPVWKLKRIVSKPDFSVQISLHLGRGRCTLYTCDLTESYVRLNKGE